MTRLRVEVAWATPAAQDIVALELTEGATVADAVAAARALERSGVTPRDAGYAIYGQAADPSTPLADGDRVEVTRPLRADPKAVRRARAKAQAGPTTPGSTKSGRAA